MEPDAFTDTLIGAAEEAQPAEISELIPIMGKQQLASSLQHMVLKWKEQKGSMTAGTQPCRSPTSDSQLLRPATGTHTGATTTSPKKLRRRLPDLPRESGGGVYHPWPTGVRRTPSTTNPRRPRRIERKHPTVTKRRPQPATTTNRENRQQNWRVTPESEPT